MSLLFQKPYDLFCLALFYLHNFQIFCLLGASLLHYRELEPTVPWVGFVRKYHGFEVDS